MWQTSQMSKAVFLCQMQVESGHCKLHIECLLAGHACFCDHGIWHVFLEKLKTIIFCFVSAQN